MAKFDPVRMLDTRGLKAHESGVGPFRDIKALDPAKRVEIWEKLQENRSPKLKRQEVRLYGEVNMKNELKREKIALAGCDHVHENHTWFVCIRELQRLLKKHFV